MQPLSQWLREHRVRVVVMESTAQCWKGVWSCLDGAFVVHLAQARSNAAPHGRKSDYAGAERLLRRLVVGDLRLRYAPDAEQRGWRMLTCSRVRMRRVQFHCTPKHASWLNMAEIEFWIMGRLCTGQRIATTEL